MGFEVRNATQFLTNMNWYVTLELEKIRWGKVLVSIFKCSLTESQAAKETVQWPLLEIYYYYRVTRTQIEAALRNKLSLSV